MTIPLLTATALSYRTPERVLLDNVHFSLNAGQKVALVGRSGAGKSLLLQALADLLPLDNANANRIMLNKNGTLTPLSQCPPHDYRHRVALFHQMPSLIDGTVLDNLKLPFNFNYYKNHAFDQNWHLKKLTKLGKSADFINQSIATLSGGERQLVNFLRTLQLNPTIALFDEITSALDKDTAKLLITMVLDWHNETKALIWITHTPAEQDDLGADLWHMDKGSLLTNGLMGVSDGDLS